MVIKFPDVRKTLKSKFFWITLVLAILMAVGTVNGQQNSELWYLQIPFAVMIISSIPAMSAHVLSIRFGLGFIWIHRNLLNFTSRNNISYYSKNVYSDNQSNRNFALYNLWYASGITFLLLRFSGIDLSNLVQLSILTIGGVLFSIVFASGINFAIFLIKRKAIFFENKKDGSVINLGSDLRRIINYSLGPLQIIFFIYTIIVESDILFFAISLGIVLLICGGGSVTSYLILKKHYINKIYDKFDNKLNI